MVGFLVAGHTWSWSYTVARRSSTGLYLCVFHRMRMCWFCVCVCVCVCRKSRERGRSIISTPSATLCWSMSRNWYVSGNVCKSPHKMPTAGSNYTFNMNKDLNLNIRPQESVLCTYKMHLSTRSGDMETSELAITVIVA